MIVDTYLTVSQYFALTNALVDQAFDNNGNYRPHYMRVAAMINFYNICVSDKEFEIIDPENVESYEDVFKNEEFLTAFSKEIKNASNANKLTFNQAFHDAKEICEYKNKNAERALTNLVNHISESVEDIGSLLTDEKISQLGKLMETFRKLSNGEEITQEDISFGA